jgi:hypothetical protein
MRARAWLETFLAVLTGALAVLTLISREWIEALTGLDPDQDSGSVEWLVVAVCGLLTVTCSLLARRSWRRVRLAASSA